MALPPFLQPREPLGTGYYNATFQHKHPLGLSHALWWPSKSPTPSIIILFIPGNPGLLDFYTQFLSTLYTGHTTSGLSIFAYSYIGHTPGIEPSNTLPASRYGLTAQKEGCIEAFDAVRSTFGVGSKVVIIGHSVGAWLALQIAKARPLSASAIFLLFPTISRIGDTPNGKRLSWLFSPRMRFIIAKLSYITRIFPDTLLALLFASWPPSQVDVLRVFLYSPTSILATLQMANDEMKEILGLDESLLNSHRDCLWFFFADKDDWVGEQKNVILDYLHSAFEKASVVNGHSEIPHSFCINHGQQLALQCLEWLTGSV